MDITVVNEAETRWFVVYRSWGFDRGNPSFCIVRSVDAVIPWPSDLSPPIFKVQILRAFWHLELDDLVVLYKTGVMQRMAKLEDRKELTS